METARVEVEPGSRLELGGDRVACALESHTIRVGSRPAGPLVHGDGVVVAQGPIGAGCVPRPGGLRLDRDLVILGIEGAGRVIGQPGTAVVERPVWVWAQGMQGGEGLEAAHVYGEGAVAVAHRESGCR